MSHLELEVAQKNSTVLLNRFIEESGKRGAEVDERIANLTILVDQHIRRGINGNGHLVGGLHPAHHFYRLAVLRQSESTSART